MAEYAFSRPYGKTDRYRIMAEQIKRNDLGTAVSVRTVTLTEDNLYTEKEGYGMLDFLSVDVAYLKN